jgi:hypothetical protein
MKRIKRIFNGREKRLELKVRGLTLPKTPGEEVNMNVQELIESLKRHKTAINGETIQKIDFDQLEKDLGEAAFVLACLGEKEGLCEKLLLDFKSEIKKMSLAVSRAKGDLSSCGLVDKLLSSPGLSFEDLLFLKKKVREEFNQSFPSSPQSKVVVDPGHVNTSVSEFKTGVRIQG